MKTAPTRSVYGGINVQDPILKAVEKLADQVEKLTNRFDSFIQNDFRELSREVSEIRGKLEGREEIAEPDENHP